MLQFHGQLKPLAVAAAMERLLDQSVRNEWVVYAKPPFGGKSADAEVSRSLHRRGAWYSLLVVEDTAIQRYGLTSSKSNKAGLCQALKSLTAADLAILLGVWTGKYKTYLFVLSIPKAIDRLDQLAVND